MTDECGNGRRPNLVDIGKGCDDFLEVINFWWWCRLCVDSGSLFHFLHQCGMENFWTFVSISHTINGRFVLYLAN